MTTAKLHNPMMARLGNQNAVGQHKPKKGELLHGDGCVLCRTCFECPRTKDCNWDASKPTVWEGE